ncbi:MAG: tryptophan--tRNA ligase, partial [Candidatus Kapabacteria bacterium]|nr:tryptophan--tRNA ligase [Candidatus Kapabacteria bacterium]
PSGELTLGQMTGALQNWVNLQNDFESFFCVVDLHAITVRQEPAQLRKRTLDSAAMFLAAGINPDKSTVFIQSHVHEHAELAWVLNTFTGFGEASRMTQFKDKSTQHSDNVNVGLFTYPVLMAADILLYQADCVPVGEDQKQHLELARDLAARFNNLYSPTFTVPEPYISAMGGRIMSLQEPQKKMSKSDPNQNATIYLVDTDEQIRNKIKRAVTDSGIDIRYDESRPGVANLMELYHIATGRSIEEIEREFDGRGYAEFKTAVGDAVAAYVRPVRTTFQEIRADVPALTEILKRGSEKAGAVARKTLRKVYKKVGFWSGE